MSHTIQDFLAHERYEIHENIERIKHGLKGESPDNPRLSGQFAMLDVQEQHLKFIEKLSPQVTTYEEAIDLCREYIIQNELSHMQIALTENHQAALHSYEWWYTLHQVQFCGDLMNRIQDGRKNHAAVR